jgi:PAS domain S-box-containing protein
MKKSTSVPKSVSIKTAGSGTGGENRFRALAETAHDAIFFTDPHGAVIFWNGAAESMFGYSAVEMAGRSLATIVPPRYRESHLRGIERALAGNLPVSGKTTEITGLRKDGHEFPIELTMATWQEKGESHLTAIARDITDRRQAEVELREREARYHTLFEESPIGLWECDVSALRSHFERIVSSGVADLKEYCRRTPEAFRECLGRIRVMDVNRAALDIFESPSKEPLLEGLHVITCAASEEDFRRALFALVRGGMFFETETIACTLGGRQKNVFLRWVVNRDEEGTASRLLMSIIDLTAHKKLESQFLQAQKMEALGRLAGGVAHDFNNLLAAITTNTELILLEGATADERREAATVIMQTAEEASRLTRQLLELSRREEPELLPLDINESIRRLSAILTHILGGKIKLQLKLAPNIPPVMAEPGRLEQVVLNLAVNARDAMPDGGQFAIATAWAVIEADDETRGPGLSPGRYVRCTFSDTGPGIDPRHLPHIFEPFFTTKSEGTGLGLSTIYGIVTSLGGGVDAAPAPGGGARFTVHLPAAQGRGRQ